MLSALPDGTVELPFDARTGRLDDRSRHQVRAVRRVRFHGFLSVCEADTRTEGLTDPTAPGGRRERPLQTAEPPPWRGCHHGRVTVIKINAITVPEDSGDELARRFADRAGAVDDQEGFEGFELLKPADDRTTWLVVTRWRDEAAFEAWVRSPAFAHGHRSASGQESSPTSGAENADGGSGQGKHSGPVGVHSELWSYEIAGGSSGNAS